MLFEVGSRLKGKGGNRVVPYKEPKIEKIHFTIGEVAEMLGVNASLIRFWHKEFPILKLQTTKKGNRIFTKEDIQQLRVIYHLVKEKGMTLKGAQHLLHTNREGATKTAEVIEKLLDIRFLECRPVQLPERIPAEGRQAGLLGILQQHRDECAAMPIDRLFGIRGAVTAMEGNQLALPAKLIGDDFQQDVIDRVLQPLSHFGNENVFFQRVFAERLLDSIEEPALNGGHMTCSDGPVVFDVDEFFFLDP